ncbi:MAG: type II toxin-antitoxin system MqsA family antitoxin [Candidatus Obscuribacterales bacterium]|nr:type II toxin-antitoxin system MqsA family antitoxin [Candidatus Obscuribacterales bacterium]
MKCVSCGKTDMVLDTCNIEHTYKGRTMTIPATGEFCPACGESLHDDKESSRLNELMLEFNKEVNRSIVDPEFIIEIRKKLNLGQQEAAAIFGGGANAFSRYENGKTKPSLALVQLLRLLDNHPELIDEIRPKEEIPKADVRRKRSELAPAP